MSRLLNDLRYALRQIRKSPGFAATAILTLALGIGANAVIFTLVDSIMLRPLPFPHQSRLMRILGTTNADIYPKGWIQQLGSHSTAFQSISGYGANTEMNVSSDASVDREFGSAGDRQHLRYAGNSSHARHILFRAGCDHRSGSGSRP